MIHYFLGLTAEAAGMDQAARKHWLDAATERDYEGSPSRAYAMLAWMALGRPHHARALIHDFEQLARGEKHMDRWLRWYQGEGTLTLLHGLALLAKGYPDKARKMWQQALDTTPDCRWARLHLNTPPRILERMCRKVSGPEEK